MHRMEVQRNLSDIFIHNLNLIHQAPFFQLDTALSKMYNYLQRFAVGLEEIVIDQALFDGEFIQEFNEAEYKLKAVS